MSGNAINLKNGNIFDVNNMSASGSQYPVLPSSGNKTVTCNQPQSSSTTTGAYSNYPNTVNGHVGQYHATPLPYSYPTSSTLNGNNTAGTGTASNSSTLNSSHPSPFLTPGAPASSTGNRIPAYSNNAILNYLGYPGQSVASSSTNSASNLYNIASTGPNTSAPSTGNQLQPHSNNSIYLSYPGPSAASSSINYSSLNAFVSNPYNTTSAGVKQNSIVANMASKIPYPLPLPFPPNAGGGIEKRRAVDQIAIFKQMVKKPRGRPPKKPEVKRQATMSSTAATTSGLVTNFSRVFPDAFATAPAAVPAIVTPSNARPTVTAKIPTPPNWLENCDDTLMSLQMFKNYVVGSDTAEYQTIVNMLQPIQVTEVEQIVNPDLWKRFVSTRTEMFRSKCDDLNILSKLGLDEREVLRCAHMSMNYNKDPLLIPYSDNMVLLFHCTRNQSNLNNILSQGLDERLSSTSGGLLGKGIYFSDDPQKSLQYDGAGSILIFAVLLGDCISVDHFPVQRTLVREPEKVAQQKRNFNDQFFDSIVARPAGHNEYVIYNRFQCCPIYKVNYTRSSRLPSSSFSNFNVASQKLPPIAWIPSGPNYAMPIQDQTNWPFFAVDLFTSMGMTPPEEENADNGELDNTTDDNTPPMTLDDKLATLINLGFEDENRNREILSRFNNDIDQTVNHFLDNDVEYNQPSTSTATNNSSTSSLPPLPIVPSTSKEQFDVKPQSVITIDLIDDESEDEKIESDDPVTTSDSKPPEKIINIEPDLPEDIAEWALEYDPKTEMEDCPICCNDFESYETSPSSWQVLTCTHKLCLACYSKILTSRFTMSNVQHTFIKCPFCQGTTGIEVGTCPDMQMTTTINPNSCKGYEPHTSYAINYSNSRFNRTAYLPHNKEGQEVLRLLQIAFDRRLCFTVGTSNTTGQENVIVWNIHHKTSLCGGVSSYGYPDPTYLDRVKWELKAYGIE